LGSIDTVAQASELKVVKIPVIPAAQIGFACSRIRGSLRIATAITNPFRNAFATKIAKLSPPVAPTIMEINHSPKTAKMPPPMKTNRHQKPDNLRPDGFE
jgi:hypothetical protein